MTTIDELLHAPVEILLAAIQERQPQRNSILTSALAIPAPGWVAEALARGGTEIQMPVLSPLAGTYTLQAINTAPSVGGIDSDRQKGAICYREAAWGRESFSVAQSGLDPLNYIADRVNTVRFDAWETTFVGLLAGVMGTTAFSSLKYGTAANEAPVGSPGSNVLWSTDVFHDTVGILGVREDDLAGGVIVMHPKLRTVLKKLDEIDYVKSSAGDFTIQYYKGLRIVVDARLVRSGTTSGFVYPFYICAPQTVVLSVAPQSGDGTLASSLAYWSEVPKRTKSLYDRVVSMVHINGTIWTPADADPSPLSIAKGGPTDAQLADKTGVWSTAYADVKNTRIVWGEVNIA